MVCRIIVGHFFYLFKPLDAATCAVHLFAALTRGARDPGTSRVCALYSTIESTISTIRRNCDAIIILLFLTFAMLFGFHDHLALSGFFVGCQFGLGVQVEH